MRLGLRHIGHTRLHNNHRHHGNHRFMLPRFFTKCTLPCLSQPHYTDYTDSDAASDMQHTSLLDNGRNPTEMWDAHFYRETEGDDDDDFDMRLSMFSNTQGRDNQPEAAAAYTSVHNDNNNEGVTTTPCDTRCLEGDSHHHHITEAIMHAQNMVEAATASDPSCNTSRENNPQNSIDIDNNWNGLRDYYPRLPMERFCQYRRLWHYPGRYMPSNQQQEVLDNEREQHQQSPRSPETQGSPRFGIGFPTQWIPQIRYRSLFDPSLWETLPEANRNRGNCGSDVDASSSQNQLPWLHSICHDNSDGTSSENDMPWLHGVQTDSAATCTEDFTDFCFADISQDSENNNSSDNTDDGRCSRAVVRNDVTGASREESVSTRDVIDDVRTGNDAENNDVTNEGAATAETWSGLPPHPVVQSTYNVQHNPRLDTPSRNSSNSSNMCREWYFYDPRLVPEGRTDRFTLETHFRGIRNQISLPDIIHPPAYDDIVRVDDNSPAIVSIDDVNVPTMSPPVVSPSNWTLGSPPYEAVLHIPDEPPPPYSEQPPSYEQTLAMDRIASGSTALTRTETADSANNLLRSFPNMELPASLSESLFQSENTIPIPVRNPAMPVPGFFSNLSSNSIMNHLRAINEELNNNLDRNQGQSHHEGQTHDLAEDDHLDIDELFDLDIDLMEYPTETGDSDTETLRQMSLHRNPVGFCLGQRPAVRWSRGMGLDRWASSHNWAI